MADTKISALSAGVFSTAADIPAVQSAANVKLSVTAAGLALLDDADAAAQRTTIGCGTAAAFNVGTSGATVPQLGANNTHSGSTTFSGTINHTITPASGSVSLFRSTGSNTGSYAGADIDITKTWNTSGAVAAFKTNITNTASAAGSRLIDLQVSSVSKYSVDVSGHIFLEATNTAGGTTGAQTINKSSGTVNFAAAASTLVVTNSLVSTSSLVFAVVRTADATAAIKSVVPGSGSFTITLSAAATAETSVGFFVIN